MRYIKLFDNFKQVELPDELALWVMDFYVQQVMTTIDPKIIPQFLIDESFKLLNKYNNIHKGNLYRGFASMEEDIEDLKDGVNFYPGKYGNRISWTWDYHTAEAFATEPNSEFIPMVAQYPINKLKTIVAMDVAMDMITERQIKLIKNPITRVQFGNKFDYVSESEILVFDNFFVEGKDISNTKLF